MKKFKKWQQSLSLKKKQIIKWGGGHKIGLTLVGSSLLPMVIMLFVWAFIGIYPFGTKSLMAIDFGQQYISFYGFLKETILSGQWSSFYYSFTKSLGGEMIGVLAYYLLSPFNIFYIITPLSQFHIAAFLTVWLRYGAIGISFAYLLIKRYKAIEFKPWLVPIFSTAYALSGMLVSYQMNPIFYDAMIMLPLLIIAVEELLDGGKPFKYIGLIALTMFFQFYMGYMICLFIALYSCYYVSPLLSIDGTWKQKIWNYIKPLLRTLVYSVIGIGLVSFLLYPVILNLMQSKGQLSGSFNFSFAFQINPFDILSKLIIGGFDATSGWVAGPNLPNIFVGAISLVGFIIYFRVATIHRNRRIAAGLVSLMFFISFVNEFASKIWHMGQNPAGFFFRFSWLLSFFMVLLAFQAIKEKSSISWKESIIGLVLVGLSCIYVWTQEYTYISLKQPKIITNFVNDKKIIVFLMLTVLFGSLAFCVLKQFNQSKSKRLKLVVILLLAIPTCSILLSQGYLFSQITLTFITFCIVLLALYSKPSKFGWLVLSIVSIMEFGYNAYLSQVTFSYADAHKFSDATISVKRVTDSVQENSDSIFYRIGSSFSYSKTTPSLLSYPGLSSFSSSLERSTINLFSYLGDVGVNASTRYSNGTALTDALYGVRYYLDINDSDSNKGKNDSKKMTFTRFSRRLDIKKYYSKTVYEDSRYIVKENPNVLSIAFGTNSLVQNINFGYNNPVSNQNIILNSMAGNKENDPNFFQTFSFSDVELENIEETQNEKGDTIYNRKDKSKLAIIRYKIVPKSSYTYYFLTPYHLKETRGKVSILLNNQWLTNPQNYTQRQLWQLTSNTEGKETVIEFRFSTDNVNMSGAALVRADESAIAKVLTERQKQNMIVSKWTDTKVEGTVNITDESNVMMTTVPYSNGWTVKVDGKIVETKKAWDSLLSFPITKGEHTIEMSFFPKGLVLGTLISLLDASLVLYCMWYDKKEDKFSNLRNNDEKEKNLD